MSYRVTASDTVSVSDTVSAVARTPNTRSRAPVQLREGVAALEAAAAGRGSPSEAQAVLKRALEAIHELADCEKRSDWSQAGWAADDIALWHAHLGARNVAHHISSSLVAFHTDGYRLRWEIDPSAVQGLHSTKQAAEFGARLAGRPILPPLRR